MKPKDYYINILKESGIEFSDYLDDANRVKSIILNSKKLTPDQISNLIKQQTKYNSGFGLFLIQCERAIQHLELFYQRHNSNNSKIPTFDNTYWGEFLIYEPNARVLNTGDGYLILLNTGLIPLLNIYSHYLCTLLPYYRKDMGENNIIPDLVLVYPKSTKQEVFQNIINYVRCYAGKSFKSLKKYKLNNALYELQGALSVEAINFIIYHELCHIINGDPDRGVEKKIIGNSRIILEALSFDWILEHTADVMAANFMLDRIQLELESDTPDKYLRKMQEKIGGIYALFSLLRLIYGLLNLDDENQSHPRPEDRWNYIWDDLSKSIAKDIRNVQDAYILPKGINCIITDLFNETNKKDF